MNEPAQATKARRSRHDNTVALSRSVSTSVCVVYATKKQKESTSVKLQCRSTIRCVVLQRLKVDGLTVAARTLEPPHLHSILADHLPHLTIPARRELRRATKQLPPI